MNNTFQNIIFYYQHRHKKTSMYTKHTPTLWYVSKFNAWMRHFLSQGMKESNCPSLRCHDIAFYLIMFGNTFFVQDICHSAVIIDIVAAFVYQLFVYKDIGIRDGKWIWVSCWSFHQTFSNSFCVSNFGNFTLQLYYSLSLFP